MCEARKIYGLCLEVISEKRNEFGLAAIFSPRKKKVVYIRPQQIVDVGTWLEVEAGAKRNEAYDVRKLETVGPPVNFMEYKISAPHVLIGVHLCYRWRRSGDGVKIFVACLEVEDVLIFHFRDTREDIVYRTKAHYVERSESVPHGHFVSDGSLLDIDHDLSDSIMQTMERRMSPDVTSDVESSTEEREEKIEAICLKIDCHGKEALAKAILLNVNSRKIHQVCFADRERLQEGACALFVLSSKRNGLQDVLDYYIHSHSPVTSTLSLPNVSFDAHVCFRYYRESDSGQVFVSCAELGKVLMTRIPGLKLDVFYLVHAKYVHGERAGHFASDLVIKEVSAYQSEQLFPLLTNLDKFIDVLESTDVVKSGLLTGIVVNVLNDSEEDEILEIFCIELKMLVKAISREGLYKSLVVKFVIRAIDEHGIYDIEVHDMDVEPKTRIELGFDIWANGAVALQTVVSKSTCDHHESSKLDILWSERFGRVSVGESDRIVPNSVYKTFVCRDLSQSARQNGILFRICDLFKPLGDKAEERNYRLQMWKEQDEWYERTHPKREDPVDNSDLPYSSEAPYYARNYDPPKLQHRRKKLRGEIVLPNELPSPPIMLCIRDGHQPAAWNSTYGIIPIDNLYVPNTVFYLTAGDWFYANLRRQTDRPQPRYFVKRADRKSDPMFHTTVSGNRIQAEVILDRSDFDNARGDDLVLNIVDVGNVDIRRYPNVRNLDKVLCLLRFTFNSKVPWELVRYCEAAARPAGEICSTNSGSGGWDRRQRAYEETCRDDESSSPE
ncbi:hypothetical protein Q1695_000617 [Nippostrongylus brasiliensis]|nr:hypothetical protein Q1695_000617 [Nippostrongylus brasiliensis]